MSPTSTVEATRKSTRQTMTAENGKISRGKYTFVTRLGLLVSDVTEKRSADAKKFQITRTGRPRKIVITCQYSKTVKVPLFTHTFVFTPKAEETL